MTSDIQFEIVVPAPPEGYRWAFKDAENYAHFAGRSPCYVLLQKSTERVVTTGKRRKKSVEVVLDWSTEDKHSIDEKSKWNRAYHQEAARLLLVRWETRHTKIVYVSA